MILAIDVGNSNIKLGLFDNNKLINSWKMSTDYKRTADESAAIMKQLFSTYEIDTTKLEGAVISSVIPQLNYSMQHALEFYFNISPMFVEPGVKTGLAIKYDNPKELGTDRIINCVAAIKKYGAPFILVDFGTATTFNVVDSKGEFVGGCITLGIKTSMESLASNTSQLPRVELIHPGKVIGTNTHKCIQSGIIYSTIGGAKYIIEQIREELDDNSIKVIATGGLSQLINENHAVFDVVDRELSLDGLNIIYNLNKKK